MTLRNYSIGFVLSLCTTLAAFGAVYWHLMSGHAYPTHPVVFGGLLVLALVQLVVQIFYFLHLRDTEEWHSMAFIFSAVVVFILVAGTLWIMANLEHHSGMPFEGIPSTHHEL